MSSPVHVIGAGLAGSEAAWQLAERGHRVVLSEMRPVVPTPAHLTDRFAELVCSNSLGSDLPDRAGGLLHAEMRLLGSFILQCAETARVPAGNALAVDRDRFAEEVTNRLSAHPLIEIRREEVQAVPQEGVVVVASGPLTSAPLAASIKAITGSDALYFYDAIAPIVEHDSLDLSICFRSSRYNKGLGGDGAEGDYLNCPLNREEYRAFVDALKTAERMPLRDFEKEDEQFFESCLPIEILASRGDDALAFGPMRPVGLEDPRTGRRPHAVLQLRQDNLAGSLYNLVGFQTNIKWGEQERILRMIPGLGKAEFIRLGQMHRNTFINSPTLLESGLFLRTRPDLFFAGQIVGVEGYAGNAATGLLAGINAALRIEGKEALVLHPDTMLGALCHYITHAEPKHFQPMKANFGILPELPAEGRPRDKQLRGAAYSRRALTRMEGLAAGIALSSSPAHPAASNA
ncbi:methylenetetrahydrofolate--tRNA-(uracil(54)-C(5))-methyltransferase (FADH(2)-oxidizing) TrmFO [Verrucomicrobium sp. GAS474]|uniref:methylenetetrahydrofolate--tRNA-(uracil(54)- C(5))-methyltransferase (FADH(2)-oxidizing) TrmFO n=1 Tax=Verrucomicrobium sp. GAS474 TaxID=1882831 RepID=UPI000B896156|nr:methylenetetrahydrofolate--tRNA-(uracil(54)-C(5))-methyltransferase (FADH(2)-oxidizing) TrmFO [Verrucomicrobium sp. GAS474]